MSGVCALCGTTGCRGDEDVTGDRHRAFLAARVFEERMNAGGAFDEATRRVKALQLAEAGWPPRKAAQVLGVDVATVEGDIS